MKNKILVFFTAIIIIIAICMVVFIPKNKEKDRTGIASTNNTTTSNKIESKAKTIDASIMENGDIEIKFDDLEQSNATFINYNSNGTNIELVAVKDGQNNIDIAFNTCQVCNGAPKAYFLQKGGKLICQNCGNSFSLKSIGASANGCNPMTISDSNVIKTDTGITISKEYLEQNKNLFVNVAKH